ncbi:MAG: matrixin family metalloprotease [Aeromicrobium sp.]|uniref:matrixin family metalloprotease n=1 Tax=Aeromicrobium sp. TaxID=1871063 RepID=UPI0039E5E88E
MSVLLSGVMVYSLVTDEMTGRAYSTEENAEQSPTFEAEGGGSYAFMATQQGSDEPVAYDSCETIRVVVNEREAPGDADEILDRALAATEEATGLRFTVVGTTDEQPLVSDEIRDGDDWRPVQISWTDSEEAPDLAGDVVGLGGSTWLEDDGHRWYVTGEVALDAPDLERLGTETAVHVLIHELGHVLGLAHVDDHNELMHPYGDRPGWGPGDLAGLAELGSGRCDSPVP